MTTDARPLTPLEALYKRATEQPQSTPLFFPGGSCTYRDLLMQLERYACALLSRGIRPSDRVVLRMRSRIEVVLICLACMRIGAIPVLLNTRLSAPELHAMLGRLQPALYFGEADQSRDLAPVPSAILPENARLFVLGLPLADLLPDQNGPLPAALPDVHAPAVLLSTSGTTAQPKFVAHTALSLAYAMEGYEAVRAPEDALPVMLAATSLAHASGFIMLLLALRAGRRFRLIPQFDAAAYLDAIEADRATWFVGAPFMYSEMLAAQRHRPRDLSSLRFCGAAGDSVRPELAAQVLRDFGTELKSVWGATEVLGGVGCGPPGSVGCPVSGARVRLLDAKGREVGCGETGELQVQGPQVALGYWEGPGRIDAATVEGWFATGDLMRFGPGGELFVEGRKKDLIIRGGVNISPLEVEAVLLLHPAVIDAGVCGAAHATLGEVAVAAVRLREAEGAHSIADILEFARERLADYKVPERLQVLTQFPRNAMGKLDRRAFHTLMQG